MDRKLLNAKRAIFKMIAQFHYPTMFEDGELYICNYCESALETAFEVLGIEENYIPLMDFCKMWENNDREYCVDEPFDCITADMHYQCMKENYESWQRTIDYFNEEDWLMKIYFDEVKTWKK